MHHQNSIAARIVDSLRNFSALMKTLHSDHLILRKARQCSKVRQCSTARKVPSVCKESTDSAKRARAGRQCRRGGYSITKQHPLELNTPRMHSAEIPLDSVMIYGALKINSACHVQPDMYCP